ncbi:MAG: hypothetical protein ACP5L5_09445, partial [Vulcanisaeta sp.]|uniref:hypothetical protein n=1 Tax=Vulcanisaeta sp. TaxID=2020871 RepID=UPI003D0D98B6
MSSAQVNADKPRICWGARRDGKLVCKEPVTDEATIEKVKELVEELERRIEKHKDALKSGSFIDEIISQLKQWLETHKKDGGKKAKVARRVVKFMIWLLRKLREKWSEIYWKQFLELMNSLERNTTDIIVTGSNSGNKSFIVHLFNKNIAVIVNKVSTNGRITISLSLSGSEGDTVKLSNTFSDKKVLKAVQHGWALTDGSVQDGHPTMSTNQPWQAALWSLCYPGEIHMYINGLSINEEDVSIKWHLTANSHKIMSKEEIVKEVLKFNDKDLRSFIVSAIWGDGHVYIKGKTKHMNLLIGLSKYDLWYGIIERLINELGFTIRIENIIEVKIRSSKAVRLAKEWFSIQDIKELVELGSSLPDGEKLKRIIKLANMEVKELGRSSITIPGTD